MCVHKVVLVFANMRIEYSHSVSPFGFKLTQHLRGVWKAFLIPREVLVMICVVNVEPYCVIWDVI